MTRETSIQGQGQDLPRSAASPRAWLVLAAALLSPVSGCIEIDGGAVELSWSFLTFTDDPIPSKCTGARIDQVRLHWQSTDPNLDSAGSTDFTCSRYRGATGFEIAEGPHILWIEPVCTNGMPAVERTYEVPDPITRNIHPGEVATLDSLLIVADDSSDITDPDAQCTCCPGSFPGP